MLSARNNRDRYSALTWRRNHSGQPLQGRHRLQIVPPLSGAVTYSDLRASSEGAADYKLSLGCTSRKNLHITLPTMIDSLKKGFPGLPLLLSNLVM